MNFFRTPGFLRVLRSLVLSGRRSAPRAARVITVPAPLSRPPSAAVVIDIARATEMAAARSAAAARVNRPALKTSRNKVLLSKQA